MKLSQRWKQTTIANKLMVWTTMIVAFGAFFQVGIAYFQYRLSKESGEQTAQQTDRVIAAYERIANTSIEALNEARRTNEEAADRAERTLQAYKELANAAGKQADASKTQAEASVQSAESGKIAASTAQKSADFTQQALRISNRPRIGVVTVTLQLEVGKPMFLQLFYRNNGNMLARDASADLVTMARDAQVVAGRCPNFN